MKTILTSCICLLLAASVSAQDRQAATTALDGKTFNIQMADRASGAQPMPNVISFSNRMFTSQNASAKGFTPTAYILKPGGEMGDYFQVILTNDKGATENWQGNVKGNEISGGVIMETPGQAPMKYPFRGTVAVANEKKAK